MQQQNQMAGRDMIMKITGVKVILTCPRQNYLFVKVLTDEPELYGVGDASLNGREASVANLIEEYLAPMMLGRDPDRIEDFWQLVYRGSYWRGGNIMMSALSGLDMALWDIKAKRAGLPLYSLLGGKCREKLLCYTHTLGHTSEARIQNALFHVREQRIKVIRLRVGLPAAETTLNGEGWQMAPKIEFWNAEQEIARTIQSFIQVREAVGDEAGIIYDLHERFTPDQAIRIIRALEPYHPYFIEDPVEPDSTASLRRVRAGTAAPLAFGELYKSRWECLPGITERLFDYLRCDLIRIGGVTEGKKLQALAEAYDIKLAWHGPNDVSPITHAVNWHMNISAPNFGIQEMGAIDHAVSEVVSGGPYCQDGYLLMNDAPGIGCDINEEAAARYPYRRAYLPICRRDDGSLCAW